MKKLILSLAAVVMVLSACTKNEVAQTPDVPITFTPPVVNAVTKAQVTDPIDGNVYPTGESFCIYANYTKDDFTHWSNDAGVLYMNGDVCSYDATLGAWTTNPPYYWPKNGYKLTFAAFSPSSIKDYVYYTSSGLTIKNYTVATEDVLYSSRTYNKTSNTGGKTYPINKTPKNSVDINFKHALSLIQFNAMASANYSTNDVTIDIKLKSITISNIFKTGCFDQCIDELQSSETAGTKDAPKWIELSNSGDYSIMAPADALTSTSVQCGSNLIVMPQTFANDAVLTIVYTVKDSRNGIEIETTAKRNMKDLFASWDPGKKYIYNISIGLEQIVFSPEMTDWAEGGTTDITL